MGPLQGFGLLVESVGVHDRASSCASPGQVRLPHMHLLLVIAATTDMKTHPSVPAHS